MCVCLMLCLNIDEAMPWPALHFQGLCFPYPKRLAPAVSLVNGLTHRIDARVLLKFAEALMAAR